MSFEEANSDGFLHPFAGFFVDEVTASQRSNREPIPFSSNGAIVYSSLYWRLFHAFPWEGVRKNQRFYTFILSWRLLRFWYEYKRRRDDFHVRFEHQFVPFRSYLLRYTRIGRWYLNPSGT